MYDIKKVLFIQVVTILVDGINNTLHNHYLPTNKK